MATEPLELELWVVETHHMGSGYQTLVLKIAATGFNH